MLTTQRFRRSALLTAAAAFVIAFILWNVPALSPMVYPFRLFVTFVHETGHGLAAILTGGQLNSFVVNGDGSGYALTSGGAIAVILPAGYLGSALFGAALFYLTNTVRHTRTLAVVLGVLLIVVTLLYTWSSLIALAVGLISGLLLVWLGLRGGQVLTLLVLNALAVLTALHAVLDLIGVINNPGMALGAVRNDAAAFSAAVAPLVPSAVWGVLWAALALFMLGAAFYYSILRPPRTRDDWS